MHDPAAGQIARREFHPLRDFPWFCFGRHIKFLKPIELDKFARERGESKEVFSTGT
jgi:hypothetical protein